MIRFRAVGSCMLAIAFWATTGSAQSLSALNGDIAVRSALEMCKTQGWEVLFDGLGGSPHGPDLICQDPTSNVLHIFESKANRSPLRTYYGHLQGTRGYVLASAKEAFDRGGLSPQQRAAYQIILKTDQPERMLRTYVARTPVVAGQPAGATVLEIGDQLSRPQQYLDDTGKVVARGIVLLVIAKDVTDGARRAAEIERLYEEGQFDEFDRDVEQFRNAARTGGRVAGALAGLWFGEKAGAALGALAASVAGPAGSAVIGVAGGVLVGVACYVGGEKVAVYIAEHVHHQAPSFVRPVVGEVRSAYNWVEGQVTWLWEDSWAQHGYHWVSDQANWLWEGIMGTAGLPEGSPGDSAAVGR
jgi:hypothetical protein